MTRAQTERTALADESYGWRAQSEWGHELSRRMDGKRDIVAAWVAREILPHEKAIHTWLSRRWHKIIDPDDVIQEAYCRISSLGCVDHIDNPIGYFRRTVQSVVTDMIRRARKSNIVPLTEIDWWNVMDSEPLADRVLEADQELRQVDYLLSQLSDVCREAILLRRVEGVPQREAARRLGVSEDVIRNHLVRGVRKILQAMTAQHENADAPHAKKEKETERLK
ncbi:sigma-70 family RNA polymerase sigma factor [Altererythrobacter sp. CC-YST694]|uniref:RNA polymerase sigma factor n=1 Tax=Altererythrobacter sp. CC-YST694 TaxID=2755038 RepID=UPI001D0064DE|nr:sigma-70 family RNA polymerase sigma factor [Altererythrobacter sp. CC-YST694]MCB5424371.1 sigma-70 family RNA polymerase sigma factor [Altererythrobacter sp. CC-YST694]